MQHREFATMSLRSLTKSTSMVLLHLIIHVLITYLMLSGWMLVPSTDAERVTLTRMPRQIEDSSRWTWTWTSSGPFGSGVGQWMQDWPGGQTKRVRYYACDLSSSTQPNQWLTSEGISIGHANRIDITIEYAVSDCSDPLLGNPTHCRHNFSLYLNKSATKLGSSSLPDPYRNLSLFEKIETSSPKVLSTGSLNQAENTETFSVKVDAANPYVYLAFHYQGGCIVLFSVSMQYYRCPSVQRNLVQLPTTSAPANGSIQVNGSCAQHTKPLTKESDLFGYCQDNGEWSTDKYHEECGCDYGYGKVHTVSGGSECRACPPGTYKDTVSNSNCTTCPLNSEQDGSRTSCECKPKFYRTNKETKNDSCSGQPSSPQNLRVTFLNASFVTVTWSPPSNNGGRSDLYYTTECKQCNDQGTECTRQCTGSNITVNQNSRLASINNLSAYTYHQLKVYAKNGVSKLAEEKNDMAKYAEVTTRTNETVPGIPVITVKQLSPISVFLSWEVKEKNGVITYYQVSYYPVGQPSKIKKFNTASNNAAITGLETGKKYRFQVQASSRVGLGFLASQTLVVLKDNQEKSCPPGTYKDTVSNSNCTTCPLNSEQDGSRTSCDCKPKFYRTDKETKNDSCSGQPSAPQNLRITFLNASFVTVTWSTPSNNGGRSDLYYTTECKQCNDQGKECTRQCTGSNITVNPNSRLASINNLSAYTYYQLKVYAKNGVSKLAEEKNDMAKYAEVTTRTNETVPGIPVITVKQLSPTSVLLSWEVEEKNGVITYYQVSYYPVDQLSKIKKFNTTSTNATITGLETGKKYHFQVKASSRVGLGYSASQTLTVLKDNQEKSKDDVTIPVLGAMVGLLLLGFAVSATVYFVRRKTRHASRSIDQKQTVMFSLSSRDANMNDSKHFHEGSFDNTSQQLDLETPKSLDHPYMVVSDDAIWVVPRENISVIKRLGNGNFGYVDKALATGLAGIPGQVIVAVKTLKENVKDKDKEDFLTELNLMMRLAPHRHVVKLYGYCKKSGGPQSIILEYLPYGDLLGYLRRSRGHEDSYCSGDLRPESRLNSKDLLRFGWMIADGMNFLADNKCVHRDLAARNVLVGEDKTCKISDFGLARSVSENAYTRSSGARLPVKWMPPESLFFGQSTIASDVWAYGIVLWELFTLGDSPYPGFKGNDVIRLVREGYRMPKPAHLSETLYSLMLECWRDKAEDRPSFNKIREEINNLYIATENYINLDVFDDALYVNFDAL